MFELLLWLFDRVLTHSTFIHRTLFCLLSAEHSSIFKFPMKACLDPQILQGKTGCNRDHHQCKGEVSNATQVREAIGRYEGKFHNGKSYVVGKKDCGIVVP